MATRMQQRRGTASQWTSANPVLNAGEIGWESDTNKFKIGDGTNHWANLDYFADIDSTVNPSFGTSITFEGATADSYETTLAVTDPTADRTITLPNATGTVLLADGSGNVAIVGNLTVSGTTTTVNSTDINIQNSFTFEGATADGFETILSVVDPTADRSVFIPDVSGTVVTTGNLSAITSLTNPVISGPTISNATFLDAAITFEGSTADDFETILTVTDPTVDRTITLPDATGTVQLRVTDVSDTEIGYLNGVTSAIQTQIDSKAPTNNASFTGTFSAPTGTITSTMISDGTIVNGDINASAAIAQSKIDGLSTSLSAKADLAGPTFTGTVVLPSTTSIGDVSSTEIGYVNGVTSSIQTQLDAKATPTDISNHSSDTTSVHGITDTSKLVVTDALSTTLDGALTVSGNLTVNGTTFSASSTSITIEDNLVQLAHENAANTVDLGIVVGYNDGAAKHAGIVRDVSDDKWKLFKGVTSEPATTVNFGQGSLDDLALNNLTAAGVVFTDGTQTKEGVPSRTPIVQKTASYSLSTLTHRDSLIEVSSTDATTITIPLDSTVNYPIGTTIDILQTNTGQVTIAPVSGSVTVNATPGLKLRTRWSSATLMKRAADTWVVFGDLTA
jgi:citrate lyase gamma subunit